MLRQFSNYQYNTTTRTNINFKVLLSHETPKSSSNAALLNFLKDFSKRHDNTTMSFAYKSFKHFFQFYYIPPVAQSSVGKGELSLPKRLEREDAGKKIVTKLMSSIKEHVRPANKHMSATSSSTTINEFEACNISGKAITMMLVETAAMVATASQRKRTVVN